MRTIPRDLGTEISLCLRIILHKLPCRNIFTEMYVHGIDKRLIPCYLNIHVVFMEVFMEKRINEIFPLIKILSNNKIRIKIVSSFSDAKMTSFFEIYFCFKI